MRRLAMALLVATTACAPAELPPTATLTPTPSVAASVITTPARSLSPTVSPTARPTLTQFAVGTPAQWPAADLYYVSSDGNAHRFNELGDVVIGRVCTEPRRGAISGDGRTVIAWCAGTARDTEDVYRVTPRPQRVAAGVLQSWPSDLSPDGTQVAAFKYGTCEASAPVCQTRALLIDVASGAEKEILASNYYLGSTLGWSELGLTHYQPECADAGCVGVGDRNGTFVWNGTRFERRSEMRFVTSGGPWQLYERLRGFSSQLPRVVIRLGPSGDIQVTPTNTREHALAVDANGQVLAWRTTGQDGTVVSYDASLTPMWTADVKGVVQAPARGGLFLTLDYTSPTQHVRLYDAQRRLVFDTGLGGVRGVALVLR